MNIKLNNEERDQDFLDSEPYSSAEERRRTGRYVAIVVGISLVCLAIYHAWVRKIPVLASLLIPALIMLLYIAWVLYTASKDKKRQFDPENGLESVIGLLPRPNLSHLDVVPAEPPPPTTQPTAQKQSSSVSSTAVVHTSTSTSDIKNKNTAVKKTKFADVPQSTPPPAKPPTLAKVKEKNMDASGTTVGAATTPKNPNSPKEFRRCYSIT